ncbi:MAG: hypothetical protein CL676_11815 [Bdellovibrionaceae bacterium]|nr:hypothetical protein [Pseudobdellovibrionaceae bacterium]
MKKHGVSFDEAQSYFFDPICTKSNKTRTAHLRRGIE